MIQLASRKLSKDIEDVLNDLQKKVDHETLFNEKVLIAQQLWNSKGGATGKKAFRAIVDELQKMCVFHGVCNYCEQSEASDIEHIHPKSFFPEFTFRWENYILACKQCNTGYKLDKCFVIDNHDESILINRGIEPSFKLHALINPRVEDPNQFMIILPYSFKFELLPGLSKKDANRVRATLQILALNERDVLIEARKSAAKYYYHRMKLLQDILATTSKEQIDILLSPYDDLLDDSLSLFELKDYLRNSFKEEITTYQHPSVWYSIKKIDSNTEPKWQLIFAAIPEALSW